MGTCGPVVQLVRTPACHAGGRRFEPVLGRHVIIRLRLVLINADSPLYAAVAQSVERILGKDEVTSSNLVSSSKNPLKSVDFGGFCFVFGTFWVGWLLRFLFDPHADPL